MEPEVAILLCTYNGERFLEEQLESISLQNFSNWIVYASDDGSSDQTWHILERYQKKWGEHKLILLTGPKKGFAQNFLYLLCSDNIQANYFAYSDQDDIWHPNKLSLAIASLGAINMITPALYCSRKSLIDEQGKFIGLSSNCGREPSFKNAIAENISCGNTMVINSAARNLLKDAGNSLDLIAHDWWTYLAITGCGGIVHYDPFPTVYYRQHSLNLVGMKYDISALMSRLLSVWRGEFREKNNKNMVALHSINGKLTRENLLTLGQFALMRKSSFFLRIKYYFLSGIYRQNLYRNIIYAIFCIFNLV